MADAKKPDARQQRPAAGAQPGGKRPAQPQRGGKGGAAAAPAAAPEKLARPKPTGETPPRLRDRYRSAVIAAMMKERGYTNPFQVPRRENSPIGCKVTLRGARMYEFVDRLVNVALPRVRDFKGVAPKAFDGRGNFALGLREQVIFPEISYDKVDKLRGMDIIVVTTAKTDEEAKALLTHLGVPFRES